MAVVSHRLILSASALVAILLLSRGIEAQELSVEDALRQTGVPWHGFSEITAETRRRVLASPKALDYFADMLEGRRPWHPGSDTSVVLFWLAESGESRFVTHFLRFANSSTDAEPTESFRMAVYGLARHAVNAEARARLASIIAPNVRQSYRSDAVAALVTVNEEPTRELLRATDLRALSPFMRRAVSDRLALPAAARGEGRVHRPRS